MSIFNKLKKEKKDVKETEIKTEESPRLSALGSLPLRQAHSPASLIRQAWVTEKASDLSNLRKYTFIVNREANKPEIEKAIRLIYGVKVADINIINTKGKAKRLGRSLGRTKTHKKAIVTLREGEKIDIIPA